MFKCLRSWKFNVGIAVIASLVLYTIKLISVHQTLPSVQWSRGIELGAVDVDKDENIFNKNLVTRYEDIDRSEITLFLVYDNTLEYKRFDELGEPVFSYKFYESFSKVSKLSCCSWSEDTYLVLYSDGDLKSLVVKRSNGRIIESKTLFKDVKHFNHDGQMVIFKKDNNLILYDIQTHTSKIIFSGELKYYDVYSCKNKHYIVYEYVNDSNNWVGQYLQLDEQWKVLSRQKLYAKNRLSAFTTYNDMRVENGRFCLVLSKRNEKSNDKKLAIITLDVQCPQVIDRYEISVIPSYDKAVIERVEKDSVSLLYQCVTPYGTNIMKGIVHNGAIKQTKTLTNTKHASLAPYSFMMNGYNYLQWYDITDNEKIYYIASNNPILINNSIGLHTIEPLHIVLTIILVSVFILLIGAIVWGISIIVPMIIVAVSQRLLRHKRWGNRFSYLIGVLSFTILQVYYTNQSILKNESFRALLPYQSLTVIIILLVAIMLVSIRSAFLWGREKETHQPITILAVFAAIDILLYSFCVLSYVATGFIITSL